MIPALFMYVLVFLAQTNVLDYDTIILIFVPLGGCVDEVIEIQENYEGGRYDVCCLQCHTFAVIHSVNGEGVF